MLILNHRRFINSAFLDQTCERSRLSFTSAYLFYQKIDALPGGYARWKMQLLEAEGDELDEAGNRQTEKVELWMRDPVECIRELMGNALLSDHMRYKPECVYADKDGNVRIYENMWTADWWWQMQVNMVPSKL